MNDEEESGGKSEATYMTMVRSVLGPAEPGVWRQEKDLGRIWQTHGGWMLLRFPGGSRGGGEVGWWWGGGTLC